MDCFHLRSQRLAYESAVLAMTNSFVDLRQINTTGKSLRIFRNRVKPRNQKYSALAAGQISCSILPVYRDKRGDRDRHDRAVGCDGREGCD
jgi:hypothetical protein